MPEAAARTVSRPPGASTPGDGDARADARALPALPEPDRQRRPRDLADRRLACCPSRSPRSRAARRSSTGSCRRNGTSRRHGSRTRRASASSTSPRPTSTSSATPRRCARRCGRRSCSSACTPIPSGRTGFPPDRLLGRHLGLLRHRGAAGAIRPTDEYDVCIDSTLEDGHLTYAEAVIPGETERGDPALDLHLPSRRSCNDNLSGIAVLAILGRALTGAEDLRYTYRLLFSPGTVGPLTWLRGTASGSTGSRTASSSRARAIAATSPTSAAAAATPRSTGPSRTCSATRGRTPSSRISSLGRRRAAVLLTRVRSAGRGADAERPRDVPRVPLLGGRLRRRLGRKPRRLARGAPRYARGAGTERASTRAGAPTASPSSVGGACTARSAAGAPRKRRASTARCSGC